MRPRNDLCLFGWVGSSCSEVEVEPSLLSQNGPALNEGMQKIAVGNFPLSKIFMTLQCRWLAVTINYIIHGPLLIRMHATEANCTP